MLLVANRFEVAEEHSEAFVERFRESVEGMDEHDGFVRFELLTPVDADTHVAATWWESRDAFDEWRDSQEFHEAHGGDAPEGMFLGHPTLEVHEVAFEYTGE